MRTGRIGLKTGDSFFRFRWKLADLADRRQGDPQYGVVFEDFLFESAQLLCDFRAARRILIANRIVMFNELLLHSG